MDIKEIEKILSDAGVHSCEICGVPYTPRTRRQRTCGSTECKEEYHRRYVAEYNRRRRRDNPEVVRRYNAAKMREYREKQRNADKRERQLKDLADHWEKQAEFDKKVTEYGDKYGEIQKQKTLANVPKIDVNLGGKKDDTVHGSNINK